MIAIIDYGLGNIKAFANVYKRLNVPFAIVTKADDSIKCMMLNETASASVSFVRCTGKLT